VKGLTALLSISKGPVAEQEQAVNLHNLIATEEGEPGGVPEGDCRRNGDMTVLISYGLYTLFLQILKFHLRGRKAASDGDPGGVHAGVAHGVR
jgi:hypothetical protein